MPNQVVQLYLYDLSMGMARLYSPMVLGPGNGIEAIYHSSIIIYGREYYFGQGICMSLLPGQTPYGTPIQKVTLGRSEIPQTLFMQYLDWLSQTTFPHHAYHLLDQNCNHFTEHVAKFLGVYSDGKAWMGIHKMMKTVTESNVESLLRPFLANMRPPQEADSEFISQTSGVEKLESEILLFKTLEAIPDYVINDVRLFSDGDCPEMWKKVSDASINLASIASIDKIASIDESDLICLECISLGIAAGSDDDFDARGTVNRLIEQKLALTSQDLIDIDDKIDQVLLKLWILSHSSARFGIGFDVTLWLTLMEKVFLEPESPIYKNSGLQYCLLAWSYNHRKHQLISQKSLMDEEELIMVVSLLCHVTSALHEKNDIIDNNNSKSLENLAKSNLVVLISSALISGHFSILETIQDILEFDLARHLPKHQAQLFPQPKK